MKLWSYLMETGRKHRIIKFFVITENTLVYHKQPFQQGTEQSFIRCFTSHITITSILCKKANIKTTDILKKCNLIFGTPFIQLVNKETSHRTESTTYLSHWITAKFETNYSRKYFTQNIWNIWHSVKLTERKVISNCIYGSHVPLWRRTQLFVLY